jgi:hypothetical protein
MKRPTRLAEASRSATHGSVAAKGCADIGADARKICVRPGEADERQAVIARHGDGEQPVADEQPGAVGIEIAPIAVGHATRTGPRVVGAGADRTRHARALAIGTDHEPGPDRVGAAARAFHLHSNDAAVFHDRLGEAHALAQLGARRHRGVREHRIEQIAPRRVDRAGAVRRRSGAAGQHHRPEIDGHRLLRRGAQPLESLEQPKPPQA